MSDGHPHDACGGSRRVAKRQGVFRKLAGLVADNQFGSLIDHSATALGWRLAVQRRRNIDPPAVDCVNSQDRMDQVKVAVVKIERTGVPAKKIRRYIDNYLRRVS